MNYVYLFTLDWISGVILMKQPTHLKSIPRRQLCDMRQRYHRGVSCFSNIKRMRCVCNGNVLRVEERELNLMLLGLTQKLGPIWYFMYATPSFSQVFHKQHVSLGSRSVGCKCVNRVLSLNTQYIKREKKKINRACITGGKIHLQVQSANGPGLSQAQSQPRSLRDGLGFSDINSKVPTHLARIRNAYDLVIFCPEDYQKAGATYIKPTSYRPRLMDWTRLGLTFIAHVGLSQCDTPSELIKINYN